MPSFLGPFLSAQSAGTSSHRESNASSSSNDSSGSGDSEHASTNGKHHGPPSPDTKVNHSDKNIETSNLFSDTATTPPFSGQYPVLRQRIHGAISQKQLQPKEAANITTTPKFLQTWHLTEVAHASQRQQQPRGSGILPLPTPPFLPLSPLASRRVILTLPPELGETSPPMTTDPSGAERSIHQRQQQQQRPLRLPSRLPRDGAGKRERRDESASFSCTEMRGDPAGNEDWLLGVRSRATAGTPAVPLRGTRRRPLEAEFGNVSGRQ